jgi:hypothetical protein
MRQLGHGLGVLLLRVGKMSREGLLVAALILRLLLLVHELVLLRRRLLLLLLLVRAGFNAWLAVLQMLQLWGRLAVRLDVSSVLAVSRILSRVWRWLGVRGGNRPDGGMLGGVLWVLRVQGLVRILNYIWFAEISYTLQRGWLCRRALVLPVKLLRLVQRNLGDAGADGRRVRRRKADALGVPAV